MLQTRTFDHYKYLPKKVTDAGFDLNKQTTPKELLLSMTRLDGFELQELKENFDNRYDELRHQDRNFMIQDFVGDYVYIVQKDDGEQCYFCKGKKAYDFYKDYGIRLIRKSKDLFPTYKTLMEKGKEYKDKTLSKADYDREYDKQNRKQVKFVLNKNTDDDIIEYLDGIENKNKYLKELIRKDMESKGD